MLEYKKRQDVPSNYRCDLTDIYVDDKAWNEELKCVIKEIPDMEQYKGRITDPLVLEEYLKKSILLENKLEKLDIYAYLQHDLDLESKNYIEMLNQIHNQFTNYNIATSFFLSSFIQLTEEEYASLFVKNPNLEAYRSLLDDIYKEKKHILNEEEEKLITKLTNTTHLYETISSTILNLEHDYGTVNIDGEEKVIAANNYRYFLHNPSQEIRKEVHDKYRNKLVQYEETAASLLYGFVKSYINMAEIRSYDSAWSEKLEDYKLPDEVFQNLVNAGSKHIPKYQKFLKLHQKIVGVSRLHDYDLQAEWSQENHDYSIEEAQECVQKSLEILGEDYHKKLAHLIDIHSVDYCQYKGKANGGYSISTPTIFSRILMNFNGNFKNVSTLVHELGHSVHHLYVMENNPSWYVSMPSVVCEIASLTNEFLLNNYMYLNGKSVEEKLKGIESTLKTIDNNFFGAIMEGHIEQLMYQYVEEGNIITAEYMNSLMKEQYDLYYGDLVSFSSYSDWIIRSHYYNFFYLFDYAICVSIAALLARKISLGEEGIVEKYIEFLSCGNDKNPEDIYAILGIDVKDPKIFDDIGVYFEEQLDLYQTLKEEGVKNG